MQNFPVKKFVPHGDLSVAVPASKSVLNRALILAALSHSTVTLQCGSLCEDTRALLRCIQTLGIKVEQREDGLTVHGCGGIFPVKSAEIHVGSAGTAARFLPAVLAFCGGDYTFTASEQMQKRPMDFLKTLTSLGAEITYLGEAEHFPFRLRTEKIVVEKIEVDTDISTQFASAFLLAAYTAKEPVTIRLCGSRTTGSYVEMTLRMLRAFGANIERNGDEITVSPAQNPPAVYQVEGDLSGACYFCALALLLRTKVTIANVTRDGLQGDTQFLNLLEEKGLVLKQTANGLLADGTIVCNISGFNADFHDFSDQTMTAAVLAPFASSPSVLKNVAHIRFQECDRIAAIVQNINTLGGCARTDGTNIYIEPQPLQSGTVTTYNDHRIAMAFALAGLKTGAFLIDNPDCVNKTFENYFEILEKL